MVARSWRLAHVAAMVLAQIGAATVARADVYEDAAAYYQLPAHVLRCIAQVESSQRMDAININRHKDGSTSEDVCAMQINSQWFPKLATFGISRAHLLADESTCVHSGAWIFAHEVRAVGLTWRAVARYHTGPDPAAEDRGKVYASKVLACVKGKK